MEATEMTFTADGRRLDVLLSEQSGLTRSRIASLMEEGRVTVDGTVVTKAGLKAKIGQTITLTFTEELNEDGTVYTDILRGAKQTDTYIATGDDRDLDTWAPLFTYHGSGLPGA